MQNEFIPKTTPMKTVQFETSKVYGLFVMLPDGAQTPRLWNLHNEPPYLTYQYGLALKRTPIDLIGTDLHNLGFVSELTDEQKAMVCECYDSAFVGKCFKDYQRDTFPIYFKIDESFASLLESLGIDDLDNWILLTANK